MYQSFSHTCAWILFSERVARRIRPKVDTESHVPPVDVTQQSSAKEEEEESASDREEVTVASNVTVHNQL